MLAPGKLSAPRLDPGVEHADGDVGRATRIGPGEEGAGIGPATGAAGARFGPVGVVQPHGHAGRDRLEFADRGWGARPGRQAKGQHHQVEPRKRIPALDLVAAPGGARRQNVGRRWAAGQSHQLVGIDDRLRVPRGRGASG